jgi:preprotein translocase subunit SecB
MSYKIIGKYIKNLNFSIPNTKTFYLLSKDISKYKINIDIKSNRVKQNIIEIFTSLNLKSTENEFESINTEIIFATIIELTDDKIDKKKLEKIILVHVPSNIYSELRSIFVRLFENSGFKDVKISESVDFEKLYNLKKIQ